MKNALTEAFREIISTLNYPETNIVVQLPKNPEHGDFATNLALQLAGKLDANPREIAQILSDKLKTDYPDLVDSTDIAGPGFINISINKNAIITQLESVLQQDKYFGRSILGKGKIAQVEFVSANPTGPLHIGHGRGAAVGDSLSRILIDSGYHVVKEYYINDTGNQIITLGQSVYLRYQEAAGEKIKYPEECYQGDYIYDIAQILVDKHTEQLLDDNYVLINANIINRRKFYHPNIKQTKSRAAEWHSDSRYLGGKKVGKGLSYIVYMHFLDLVLNL